MRAMSRMGLVAEGVRRLARSRVWRVSRRERPMRWTVEMNFSPSSMPGDC